MIVGPAALSEDAADSASAFRNAIVPTGKVRRFDDFGKAEGPPVGLDASLARLTPPEAASAPR